MQGVVKKSIDSINVGMIEGFSVSQQKFHFRNWHFKLYLKQEFTQPQVMRNFHRIELSILQRFQQSIFSHSTLKNLLLAAQSLDTLLGIGVSNF